MKNEKSAQQKVFEKRGMFLKIGYAIAIGMVILAFQWKGKETKPDKTFKFEETTFFSEISIRTKQKEPVEKKIKHEEVIKKIDEIIVIEVKKEETSPVDDFKNPFDFDMDDLPGETGVISTTEVNDSTYRRVEIPPEFIGGPKAMYDFLKKNLKFPAQEQDLGLTGAVKVVFVIDKDGSVINTKVDIQSYRNFNKEAIRVIESMPKWKPGMQQGRKVKVYYQITIRFGNEH
jgi:periplasmic protein TonB